MSDIANALIIAVKAFKTGLTNAIVLPAMDDDPHGAFDQNDVATVPASMKLVFDGFMNDLTSTNRPRRATRRCRLLATRVITHPRRQRRKNCTQKTGWVDSTPGNTSTRYTSTARVT